MKIKVGGLRAEVKTLKTMMAQTKVPHCYTVTKKRVVCAHCGADTFMKKRLFSLYELVCSECSWVALFSREPAVDGESTEA